MGSKVTIGEVTVYGVEIDPNSRCRHWHSILDIVALKFACCGNWFACFDCHRELADHEPGVWSRGSHEELAAMCGACGRILTVSEYTDGDSTCPRCAQGFNPGCAKHYHLYFERD